MRVQVSLKHELSPTDYMVSKSKGGRENAHYVFYYACNVYYWQTWTPVHFKGWSGDHLWHTHTYIHTYIHTHMHQLSQKRNWNSSVNLEIRLWTVFLFSKRPDQLGSSGSLPVLSPQIKWLRCKAEQSLPSRCKVKNVWNCTSFVPRSICVDGGHGDKFSNFAWKQTCVCVCVCAYVRGWGRAHLCDTGT